MRSKPSRILGPKLFNRIIMPAFVLAFIGICVMHSLGDFSSVLADTVTSENRIGLTEGPSLNTYKTYQRFVGYRFSLDEQQAVTPDESSSLVLKFENHSQTSTAFAFYLNGTLNSGSSAAPKTTYLYNGDQYVKNINHVAYSVGYYNSISATSYNHVVIPLTNFPNVTLGNIITIEDFNIAIRLKGVADNVEGTMYSQANAGLMKAYLLEDYIIGESLNLSALQPIYTPRGDNFTIFDSSTSTPITENCVLANYQEGASMTLTTSPGGTLTSSHTPVYLQDSITLTVTPTYGYALTSLVVNDSDVTNLLIDNKYSLVVTTSPLIAHADFIRVALEEPTIITENGIVTASNYNVGEDVIIKTRPDTGYELEQLLVNDIEVTTNKYGSYMVTNAQSDMVIEALFSRVDSFYMEEGAYTSIYNHKQGTAGAVWDVINIMTMSDMSDVNEYQQIGITTDLINQATSDNEYLVVNIQNLDAGWRTFYVDINGQQRDGLYYMVDRLGNVTSKIGPIITEKFTRFSNATFDLGTTAVEGFVGMLVIPISNYPEIDIINNVSVYSGTKNKANARFNVGSIYLIDDFNPEYVEDLIDDEKIWHPSSSNFTDYIHGETNYTEQIARTRFMQANDFIYGPLDEDLPSDSGVVNYDTYYATLPQNMIGSDGYVNLASLGIKGIVMDVTNHNLEQVQFAIRIAGSDNNSLTNVEKTLWQTSIAGGYYNKIIYDSGLVRQRAPAFLPYDESGHFSGKVYIPLSNEAFTNIGKSGSFPTLIQPAIRFLFKADVDYDYKANISNIRFVTSDEDYETYSITLSAINGTINAMIGDTQVGAASNNNVLYGTSLSVTVSSDRGYEVESLSYSADGEEIFVEPNNEGVYIIVVTDDIVIFLSCAPQTFSIIYHLSGGENHPDNPMTFVYGAPTMVLHAPTREGYTFAYWANEDGEEVTEIDGYSIGNVILTAVWKANVNIPLIVGVTSGGAVLTGGGLTALLMFLKRRRIKL
jgi:uncharacterized repeat protein (TIGR02543 family)